MKTTITTCFAALTIVAALLGAGCSSDESLAGTHPTPTTTSATTAAAPSFAELDAALALDSGDETVVRRALADWDNRPRARQSEMKFVADVASSLDNDQLEKLVDLMVERRDARREQIRERRGELTREQLARTEARSDEHRRKHRGADAATKSVERKTEWLDAALQLTDDQESRVSAALTTTAQARASIRASRRDQSITREQAHDRMRAAHETMKSAMESILTEEQQARLEILQPLFPRRGNRT